jgi:protein disulfide-isomerase A1
MLRGKWPLISNGESRTVHDTDTLVFVRCEICRELEPVYEGIASSLDESKDITLARVDCVAQSSICEEYGTPIYPTLRLFQGLQNQAIYNGARTSDE